MPRDRLLPSPAAATPVLHSRAAKDRSDPKTSGFHRATTRATPGHALISAFPPPCLFHLIPPINPALHRSPVFLIGLFPIVLLLWAWADSVKMHATWHYSATGERAFFITFGNSNLGLGCSSPHPNPPQRFTLMRTPIYGSIERFPRARGKVRLFPSLTGADDTRATSSPYFICRIHRLPIWFVLAAYLPLWLGLSYWRSRSKLKRLAAALPESGAAAV